MSLHSKQVSISSPMFNSISNSRILPQFRVSFLPITRLHCLSLSPSPISLSNPENPPIKYPFKVSYVMNTFGWPPENAISKTRHLNFKTPEKPERVLAFLKKHGFSITQIARIVKIWPQILRCDPENTLLPKLEFLSNLGLSRTEITDVVTKAPLIWRRSLEGILIPNFNLVSNLLNSNEEAVNMVKRNPIVFINTPAEENVQILLEAGVPGANIVASRCYTWKRYEHSPKSFRKLVEEVKEMGFDPCRMTFMWALQISKSTWKDKVEVFKKYGWSDRDIFLAFEKNPKIIRSSKDKIDVIMDFLVNRVGMETTDIVNVLGIIHYSFEKRIVPRWLVYQSMVEKGLCKKKYKIYYLCHLSEDQFLAKIMEECEDQAPELLEFYKQNVGYKKMS